MQQSIQTYRFYLFDDSDHIASSHDVEAHSDDHACELADTMLREQSRYATIEVWDRARKVYRRP